jgi:D-alanyl-D-alanine carboxypeptidase/D-alanyl-D-alanine-endopeptidase (penicillin-binding protein 4)
VSRFGAVKSAGVLGVVLVTGALTLVSTGPGVVVRAADQAAPVPSRPRNTPSTTAAASSSRRTATLEQLQQALTAVTHMPGVERGVWGVVVQSLDRSDRLFEVNPRTLLVPASTAKLLSMATAIDAVGWMYRFETTLQTNGMVADGVLHGDLVVVGSGDPSTGGRAGDDFTGWIDAVKMLGIREIDGRIIGDDDLLEEPRPQIGWAWDDLATSGALYGALNLEENRTTVTVTPALTAGESAQVALEPIASERPLIDRVTTGERSSTQLLWGEQRPGETALTIAGSIPAGAMPAKLSVAVGNPTLWFVRALRFRLNEAGIAVSGDAVDIDDLPAPLDRSTMMVLYTHRSRPLSELIRPLFKDSINLYGEAMFRLNAPRANFTNDAAIDGMRQRMIGWGIGADGEQFVDGSGLSRRDVVSAETMVAILARMYDPDPAAPWMVALPLAGVDGTLANRMRSTPAERNLRAKTGSMSNVRSLAGYVTTRSGEHLAFAAMVNNFEGTGAEANQALDTIAVTLATFSRPTPASPARPPASRR